MTERERQIIANALRVARIDAQATALWARSNKMAPTLAIIESALEDYERLVPLFEQGGSPLNEWLCSQEAALDQS